MIRQAGAAEVHMRIASPPTKHSCFYGIDTPHESELLANTHDLEAMTKHIGVDSLAFVSIDGLYRGSRRSRGAARVKNGLIAMPASQASTRSR